MRGALPLSRRGRGKPAGGARHWVMLEHYLLDHIAYRSLSSHAKSIYTELKRRYNGKNNGLIVFSTREAGAAINAGNDTGARALIELQEHGLIVVTEDSTFNRKVHAARNYRLTEAADDRPGHNRIASKEFLKWTPPTQASQAPQIQNTVALVRRHSRTHETREAEIAQKSV
jgi:hypothetical protein